jgi:hypothetical protein
MNETEGTLPKQISFKILSVKEVEYSCKENYKASNSSINISMTFFNLIDEKKSTINLVLSVSYHDKKTNEEFLKIRVDNIFGFKDLSSVLIIEKKEGSTATSVLRPVIATLFGVSFSHVRALISRHINGTALEEFVLPIINPEKVIAGMKEIKTTKVLNSDE